MSLSLAIALVLAPPVEAEPIEASEPPAPQVRTQHLSPAETFDLADRAFRAGDVAGAEQILVALTANPEIMVRNEARFRLAMLFRATGRDPKAAAQLRRILDEEPAAGRVRLELAAVLHAMGENAPALRELRALGSLQLPPGLSRFVDRFGASMQARKKLGFFLEVALAPDSNIARVTDRETLETVFGEFEIVDDGAVRSGVGLAMKGLMSGRQALTDRIDLTAQVSARANLYRDQRFSSITGELAIGPEMRIGRTQVSASLAHGESWFGGTVNQRYYRLAIGAARPLGSRTQLRLDGALGSYDNEVNDLQDGWSAATQARVERAMSPRLTVSLTAGAARYSAADDAYSNWSWNLATSASQEIGRMTLIGGLDYGELKADERLALLPRARHDRSLAGNVGLIFRQISIMGVSPLTRIVFERNRSTVEFYDYSRTRAEVGFSKAF